LEEARLNLKTKLFKNTIANYLIRFWTLGVYFFLFPFIVHYLGMAATGIWLLINSLTGYFGILNLGIGPSLTKYVAQYKTRRDEKKLSQCISTTFFIYLAMGLLAAIGLIMVGLFLITSFNIPPKLLKETKIITYIAATTMLFGFPMATFKGVLQGLQRYDICALVDFVASIPKIVLILFLLPKGYGVVALVLINLGSSLLRWLLNAYYTKKFLPSLHISFGLFKKEMIRILFGLAVSIFIINICMRIIYHTDRLIIGGFLSVGLIVFYEAAYRIYQFIAMIPQLLASAVIPAASELDTINDARFLKSLFLKGTKYMMAFFLAIVVPALVLSKQILIYWMGKEFGSYYLLVVIFILHLFFNYNHLFAYYLLVGMNKIRFPLWYYIGSALLNLALSIILVQKIGLIGVVLGTAVPYAILEPVFVWYIFKTFDVKLSTYLKEVLGKVYPQAGFIVLLLYLLTIYYSPHSLIEVGIFAVLSVIAYLLLFYVSGVEEREKKSLLATAAAVLGEIRYSLVNNRIFR